MNTLWCGVADLAMMVGNLFTISLSLFLSLSLVLSRFLFVVNQNHYLPAITFSTLKEGRLPCTFLCCDLFFFYPFLLLLQFWRQFSGVLSWMQLLILNLLKAMCVVCVLQVPRLLSSSSSASPHLQSSKLMCCHHRRICVFTNNKKTVFMFLHFHHYIDWDEFIAFVSVTSLFRLSFCAGILELRTEWLLVLALTRGVENNIFRITILCSRNVSKVVL
jgi:hypothetical protein